MSEWISVKDKLPDEEGLYIVNTVPHNFVSMAWYNGKEFEEDYNYHQIAIDWQPLPEPPSVITSDGSSKSVEEAYSDLSKQEGVKRLMRNLVDL